MTEKFTVKVIRTAYRFHVSIFQTRTPRTLQLLNFVRIMRGVLCERYALLFLTIHLNICGLPFCERCNLPFVESEMFKHRIRLKSNVFVQFSDQVKSPLGGLGVKVVMDVCTQKAQNTICQSQHVASITCLSWAKFMGDQNIYLYGQFHCVEIQFNYYKYHLHSYENPIHNHVLLLSSRHIWSRWVLVEPGNGNRFVLTMTQNCIPTPS